MDSPKRQVGARTAIVSIHAVIRALHGFKFISSFYVNEKTKRYHVVWTKKGAKFASDFVKISNHTTNILTGDFHVSDAMSEVLWTVMDPDSK
jgi:hypothetical protein